MIFLPGFLFVVFSLILQPTKLAYVLGDVGYWLAIVAVIIAIRRESSNLPTEKGSKINIFEFLYHTRTLSRLFRTLPYVLQSELRDCNTVLDLGCGPNSPIASCRSIQLSVGVEPFKPYFEQARARKTHTEFLNCRIEELALPDRSFDAVVLIEVIEHMEEAQALDVLSKAQRWAKKKVIVTSPNGFVPQGAVDGNRLQCHLSGWPLEKLQGLGFRCVGLAGLKFLRRDAHAEAMTEDLLDSIRWRPRRFWFAVAALSQLLTYRVPSLAFGLFGVKNTQ